MKVLSVTFSPLTAEPAYLSALGEAMLAAQWQIVRATMTAQTRLFEEVTRAIVAAQFGVLDVMFQATFPQD
jgi:hypothetical protein